MDIASPNGGAVEADQYDPNKAYNREVLADDAIMRKLNNTLALRDLSDHSAAQYSGIFVVGGKGAMFDLPTMSHCKTSLQASTKTRCGSGSLSRASCAGKRKAV